MVAELALLNCCRLSTDLLAVRLHEELEQSVKGGSRVRTSSRSPRWKEAGIPRRVGGERPALWAIGVCEGRSGGEIGVGEDTRKRSRSRAGWTVERIAAADVYERPERLLALAAAPPNVPQCAL